MSSKSASDVERGAARGEARTRRGDAGDRRRSSSSRRGDGRSSAAMRRASAPPMLWNDPPANTVPPCGKMAARCWSAPGFHWRGEPGRDVESRDAAARLPADRVEIFRPRREASHSVPWRDPCRARSGSQFVTTPPLVIAAICLRRLPPTRIEGAPRRRSNPRHGQRAHDGLAPGFVGDGAGRDDDRGEVAAPRRRDARQTIRRRRRPSVGRWWRTSSTPPDPTAWARPRQSRSAAMLSRDRPPTTLNCPPA